MGQIYHYVLMTLIWPELVDEHVTRIFFVRRCVVATKTPTEKTTISTEKKTNTTGATAKCFVSLD